MDDLRFALLIAGVVFVAGIYVFTRFRRRDGVADGDTSDAGARGQRGKAGRSRKRHDKAAVDDASDAGVRGSRSKDGRDRERNDAAAGGDVSKAAARGSRRKTGEGRKRRGASGTPAQDSLRKAGGGRDERHRTFDLRSTDSDYDIEDLGGVFASDAEFSVDVSVLSGLRATYESTMDSLVHSTDAGAADTSMANADAADAGATDSGTVGASTMDASIAEPSGVPEQPILDLSRPVVHLLLLAKYGRLSGRTILGALEAESLRPGPLRIYYWRSEPDPSIAFGVANLAEPGALEPDSLPDMEVQGLVTFMCVPDDVAQARETLDAMIAVSRRLSRRLDAALCDETRSTLATQSENHLREKVVDIARRSRLKG